MLDHLTIRLVDKYLSLNARFFASVPEKMRPAMTTLIDRARIATLIHLLWIEAAMAEGERARQHPPTVRLASSDLVRLLIPLAAWQDMLALSDAKPAADRFVHRVGDDRYQIGLLSIEQMLAQYCAIALNGLGNEYGKWFEKYLLTCLDQELPRSRYRVFEGFLSKTRSSDKYDVDMIIEDVEANHFFLCQTKFRETSAMPFFRRGWHEFFQGNQFPDAIRQLTALAAAFDDPTVLDQVRTRTGRKELTVRDLKERTSRVIIHTMSEFDLGRYDGILFYEWNTLRNLLRRQIGQTRGKDMQSTTISFGARVPIEDLEATIAYVRDEVLAPLGSANLDQQWRHTADGQINITWADAPSGRFVPRWLHSRRALTMPLS